MKNKQNWAFLREYIDFTFNINIHIKKKANKQ